MSTTLPLQLSAGSHAVILYHGLSSSPLELQYLARGLNRAGYTVRLPVIDGYTHGRPSSEPRRCEDWIEDALSEFDMMQGKYASVTVGGLCMGADLALCVAAQRSSLIAGVIAMSTTLHFDGWATTWTRRLLPLAPFFPFTGRIAVKESEPFGLKDERLRKFIAAQMKVSGGSSAGAAVLRVRDLLQARRLMRKTKLALKEISAPTFVMHAREDDVASTRSAYDVVAGVQSTQVQCMMLNNSYHMISIDQEKAKVLSELEDFVGKCSKSDRHRSAQVAPVAQVAHSAKIEASHVSARNLAAV